MSSATPIRGRRQDPHRDRARRSARASPANACSSRPPPNGSRGSPRPNAKASLEAELRRLSFIPLIVVDEVGYIPFDPQAASRQPSSGLLSTGATGLLLNRP